MLEVRTTPIVGLPQSLGWSQVIEQTSPQGFKCICAFAVAGNFAGSVGRNLVDILMDSSLDSEEVWYQSLFKMQKKAEEQNCKISLSSIFLMRRKAFFATHDASIFLKRDRKMGRLLKSAQSLSVIEGRIMSDDVLIASTKQAGQFLSEIEIKFNQGYELETIITSIVPGIHSQDDSSTSALVFVECGSEKTNSETQQENISYQSTKTIMADEVMRIDRPIQPKQDLDYEGSDKELQIATENIERNKIKKVSKITVVNSLLWLKDKTLIILPHLLKKSIDLVASGVILVSSQINKKHKKKLGLSESGSNISNLQKETQASPISSNNYQAGVPRLRKISINDSSSLFSNAISRKKTVIILVILMLVLMVGGGRWLIYNNEVNRDQAIAADLLAKTTLQLGEVRELKDADVLRARAVLNQTIQELEVLEKTHSQNKRVYDAILAQLTQARLLADEISGSEEWGQLEVIYDLRNISSDFISTMAVGAKDQVVLVDKDQLQALIFDLRTQETRTIDLADAQKIINVASTSNSLLVLGNGIWRWSIDQDSEGELIKNEGDSNRDGTLIAAFDRFIYVLNPNKRSLYRYSQTETGFSDPIGWLQTIRGLDFERIRSIAVDGLVWLTTSQGEIKQFAGGQQQEWEIVGLEKPFNTTIKLYTSPQEEYLYILDVDDSRIVVLTKEGVFVREISSSVIASATALLPDESRSRILVVSGSMIFSIPL